jgi:hypothetical protein
MLTDIQIVGEGELQHVLNNYQQEPKPEPQPQPQSELEPEPEPKPEQIIPSNESKAEPEPAENPQPVKEETPPPADEAQQLPAEPPVEPQQPQLSEPSPEESASSDDEIVFEELSQNNPEPEPEPEKEIPEQKIDEPKKEENVVQEEPVPKPEKKEPVPEVKKKPKKRKEKILQEVIKHAEKKKAKEKNRKKILEIAEKAEKNGKKKKDRDNAFDKMLNNSINDLKKSSGKGSKGTGGGSFGAGASLADTDYEIISSQIYPHWAVPSGVRDAENIIIEVEVQLRDNGEVIPSCVKILDERRYASDYVFRAAADSARRAVLEASPLKIPRDKINLFKNFVLRFILKEALGG